VVIGKSLAAGYMPLSAVLTNNKFETLYKDGSGRIETSCTFQGHSTACAAAIAAQSILLEPKQLVQTEKIGALVRDILGNELQKFEFIIDIRGRGIRNSIEYNVEEPNIFGQHIASILNQEENILVSGKWHRLSLTHSVLIDQEELIEGLRAVTRVIKNTHSLWTAKYRKNIKKRDFY
jgi:adenosylmethionine-8-amino-7-oxononanoate aminotransferase